MGAMLGMCSLEDGRIAGVWVRCWVCAHLKMDGLLVCGCNAGYMCSIEDGWIAGLVQCCMPGMCMHAHLKMEGSMWYVAGALAYRLEFML